MNPRITGAEIKLPTHPIRTAPKEKKRTPIKMARVDVNELNSAVPCVAIAPTVSAEIRH
jgi:hypothetical protein